jgi:hypothetical protein
MPSESTPLLSSRNTKPSFAQRVAKLLKSEGEPSWAHSYKYFFFSSYFNLFLVFVPLSACSHYLNWDAAIRFSFSFIAIIPLAKVCSLLVAKTRRSPDIGSCSATRLSKCPCPWAKPSLASSMPPLAMPLRSSLE